MARKKSWNDIVRQRDRIVGEIAKRAQYDNDGFLSDKKSIERYKKVSDITKKYLENLKKTKFMQKGFKAMNDEFERTDALSFKTVNKYQERGFSQSTYRGMSNG